MTKNNSYTTYNIYSKKGFAVKRSLYKNILTKLAGQDHLTSLILHMIERSKTAEYITQALCDMRDKRQVTRDIVKDQLDNSLKPENWEQYPTERSLILDNEGSLQGRLGVK